jgi:hypothetical protein
MSENASAEARSAGFTMLRHYGAGKKWKLNLDGREIADTRRNMPRDDKSKRAGELRDQGLTLQVIASRLGVGVPQASRLVKAARPSSK